MSELANIWNHDYRNSNKGWLLKWHLHFLFSRVSIELKLAKDINAFYGELGVKKCRAMEMLIVKLLTSLNVEILYHLKFQTMSLIFSRFSMLFHRQMKIVIMCIGQVMNEYYQIFAICIRLYLSVNGYWFCSPLHAVLLPFTTDGGHSFSVTVLDPLNYLSHFILWKCIQWGYLFVFSLPCVKFRLLKRS